MEKVCYASLLSCMKKTKKTREIVTKIYFSLYPPPPPPPACNQLQEPSSDIEIFIDDISHQHGLLLVQ